MAANRPWLAADVVVVPGAQHPLPKHPKKLFPKFDPNNDITPKDHIKHSCFPLGYWMCNMKMWSVDYFLILL